MSDNHGETPDNLGDLPAIAAFIGANVTAALTAAMANVGKAGAAGALAQGVIFEITKHSEWAVRSYETASLQNPSDLEPLARLIIARIHAGQFKAALADAFKLTSLNPKFCVTSLCQNEKYTSYTLLAECLLINEQTAEAAKAYEAALKTNGEDTFAAGRLAQLLLHLGETERATKLAAKTGNSPRFRQLRAMSNVAQLNSSVLPRLSINDIRMLATSPASVAGRPLMVDGSKMIPDYVQRTGCALAEPAERPDSDTEIMRYWVGMGGEEYSSVASFARFLLELLHFGAPRHLVDKTIAALADEARHAGLAFEIAARFANSRVGAGPLDCAGVLRDVPDLRQAVRQAFVEGCIGETAGAEAARIAGARAQDEQIRTALAGIAQDEHRHADLAWDFVAWACEKDSSLLAEVRTLLEAQIDLHSKAREPAPARDSRQPAEYFGLLSESQISEISDAAFQSLVLPRAEFLLAGGGTLFAGSALCDSAGLAGASVDDEFSGFPCSTRPLH